MLKQVTDSRNVFRLPYTSNANLGLKDRNPIDPTPRCHAREIRPRGHRAKRKAQSVKHKGITVYMCPHHSCFVSPPWKFALHHLYNFKPQNSPNAPIRPQSQRSQAAVSHVRIVERNALNILELHVLILTILVNRLLSDFQFHFDPLGLSLI